MDKKIHGKEWLLLSTVVTPGQEQCLNPAHDQSMHETNTSRLDRRG